MLRAPRGVTKTAGAKAYAVKLATSPTITATPIFTRQIEQLSPKQKFKNLPIEHSRLTRDHARPP